MTLDTTPVVVPSQVSIGLAVLSIRRSAGLTLEQLSQRTGVSESSLSRIETGIRKLSLAESVAIAGATGFLISHFDDLIRKFAVDGTGGQAAELQQEIKAIGLAQTQRKSQP